MTWEQTFTRADFPNVLQGFLRPSPPHLSKVLHPITPHSYACTPSSLVPWHPQALEMWETGLRANLLRRADSNYTKGTWFPWLGLCYLHLGRVSWRLAFLARSNIQIKIYEPSYFKFLGFLSINQYGRLWKCLINLITLSPWKESYDQPRQHIKKQRHHFVNKGLSNQGYGFSVVMYGCESWTIKKAEHWRIDAFELWFWRRPLRVPWTTRRSNQSILKQISPGCSLEGLMLKLKL